MIKKLILTLLILVSFFGALSPSVSYAANEVDNTSGTIEEREVERAFIPRPDNLPGVDPNRSGESQKNFFLQVLLPTATNILFALVTIICFISMIAGGIQMSLSFGSEDAIDKGKKTIIWSLVGFGIAILSYTIVSIIANFDLDLQNSATESISQLFEISTVHAQSVNDLFPRFQNPNIEELDHVRNLPSGSIPDVVSALVLIVLQLSWLIVLIAGVLAGIFMISARGNEERIAQTRKTLIWLGIGFLFISAAYALISGALNIDFTGSNNPEIEELLNYTQNLLS